MIPHRIRVSRNAANRLRILNGKTGLTPNILSRFAFVRSIRDMKRAIGKSNDLTGLEFNSPTLFGEYQFLYELLIFEYVARTSDDREIGTIVAVHIESGLHSMGHVRKLQDLMDLESN